MADIVGIGACVYDVLIPLRGALVPGAKIDALKALGVGGGPCATGLVAARKLGASAAFLGAMAGDAAGDFLRDDFRRFGVDISLAYIQPGARTMTSYVLVEPQSAERTCVVLRNQAPRTCLNADMRRAIRQAGILLVDGNDLEAAIQGAALARENGVDVLMDAGGLYPGVERLLEYANILIPSEAFARQYTGVSDVKEAALRLRERFGTETLVVTRGGAGGLCLSGAEVFDYRAFPVEAADTNGAGDVFHGAYAAACVMGLDARRRLDFAGAAAAIKCTKLGARAGAPNLAETRAFLRARGICL